MKIIGKNNTTVTSEDNTLVMVVSIWNSFKFEQKNTHYFNLHRLNN